MDISGRPPKPREGNAGEPGSEKVLVLEGVVPPEGAAYDTTSLLYLPFEVPVGVTRIHVRREMEPSVRDTFALLVFDAGGDAPGAPDFAGFRGYQGAVNLDTEFTITGEAETTTPWYTPGPLPAGRWHLAQWHIQPTPSGLRYRYTITLGFDGPMPPDTAPAPKPWPDAVPETGPAWYMGSLHNHTVVSYDAHLGGRPRTLHELAAEHHAAGFHFLAVTDHNQARAHMDLAETAGAHPDMLLLAGVELTTLNGHAGIVGGNPGSLFDFRLDPGDGRIRAIREEARAQGALFIVNHPDARCIDCGWRYRDEVFGDADAIEAWNREWSDEDRLAVDTWDGLLKAGRRVPIIGGTDYHRGPNAFTPVLWVHAQSLSRGDIFEAIRRGRSFVSEGPSGPRLFLTDASGAAMPGDTITSDGDSVPVSLRVVGGEGLTARLVWAGGESREVVEGTDTTIHPTIPATDAGYVRAELLHPDERMAALTNPLYVLP